MRTILPAFLVACGAADLPDVDADSDGAVDTAPAPLRFAFPVDPRTAISSVVGYDHDPATGDDLLARATCRNYAGDPFPACYDEHDGSDFILRDGFEAMDAGSALVTAAAEGEVVEVVDGNYDRCHASASTGSVDCDGHERVPNKVVLVHAGGVRTSYLHLMKGSPLVDVGDVVTVGTPLARIGSSGNSSVPHLHFEVALPDGTVVDPYVPLDGPDASLWCEQEHGDGLPGPCP